MSFNSGETRVHSTIAASEACGVQRYVPAIHGQTSSLQTRPLPIYYYQQFPTGSSQRPCFWCQTMAVLPSSITFNTEKPPSLDSSDVAPPASAPSRSPTAQAPTSASSRFSTSQSPTTPTFRDKRWPRWKKPHHAPNDWWFASTGIPLLAATLGPLANVSSIAALVTSWRQTNVVAGEPVSDFDGVPFADPKW
jgi:hypothetical protein